MIRPNILRRARLKVRPFLLDNLELIVAATLSVILLVIARPFYFQVRGEPGFKGNLVGEAFGLLSDIIVFGILIVVVNKRIEKKRDIKRWQEEIDDLRGWDEKEAMFRFVGAVKRLNKAGITEIDLSECFLENAFLNDLNLRNSNLTRAYLLSARFVNSNLEATFFRGAKLKRAWFINADLTNADLSRSFLEGAMFGAANLQGANLSHAICQGAEFDDTVLQGACFLNADLRNVRYLEAKQLMSARTLYRAKLDRDLEEELRAACPRLFDDPRAQ